MSLSVNARKDGKGYRNTSMTTSPASTMKQLTCHHYMEVVRACACSKDQFQRIRHVVHQNKCTIFSKSFFDEIKCWLFQETNLDSYGQYLFSRPSAGLYKVFSIIARLHEPGKTNGFVNASHQIDTKDFRI
jgi:hypothetical protein